MRFSARAGTRKRATLRVQDATRYAASIAMLLAVLTPAGHDAGSAAEVAAPSWIAHPQAAFDLSATEVTVAQYRACIGAGACVADAVDSGCNYGNDDKQTHPVNCVTHVGATQFCAWAGGRLCSQSEWLAACRGIDNRAFPYGEIFDLGTCNANSTEERPEGRPTGTWPVGSHPSCQGGLAGLYDMAGNVAEWIADCKGTYCKFRGGSHMSNPPVSYFTACTGVCSGNQETLKSGAVGFRCCRDGGGNGTVH